MAEGAAAADREARQELALAGALVVAGVDELDRAVRDLHDREVCRRADPQRPQAEQVKAVDKARIVKRLGTLPTPLLAQGEQALKNTLGLR